jgi:hypothetical protein
MNQKAATDSEELLENSSFRNHDVHPKISIFEITSLAMPWVHRSIVTICMVYMLYSTYSLSDRIKNPTLILQPFSQITLFILIVSVPAGYSAIA